MGTRERERERHKKKERDRIGGYEFGEREGGGERELLGVNWWWRDTRVSRFFPSPFQMYDGVGESTYSSSPSDTKMAAI